MSSHSATRTAAGTAVATAPDVLLALAFLTAWLAPALVGPDLLPRLALILVLEFFVIQAAGFLGVAAIAPFPRGLRAVIVAALAAVYMSILRPLAGTIGAGWLVWAFWALVLNRLWALAEPALAVDLRSSQPLQTEWGKTGVIYAGLAIITAMAPVPALGLGAVQPAERVILWTGAPQRAMAFGVGYFGLIAWRRLTRVARSS